MWEPYSFAWGSPPPGMRSILSPTEEDQSKHFTLRWNFHYESMSESLEKYYSAINNKEKAENFFSDITIVCKDGSQFYCHKIVLASGSLLFRELFQSTCEYTIILLDDVSGEITDIVLRYLYLGSTNAHKEKIAAVMNLATSLRVMGLTPAIVEKDSEKNLNDSLPQEISARDFQNVNSTSTPVVERIDERKDLPLDLKINSSTPSTPLSRPPSPRLKINRELAAFPSHIPNPIEDFTKENVDVKYNPQSADYFRQSSPTKRPLPWSDIFPNFERTSAIRNPFSWHTAQCPATENHDDTEDTLSSPKRRRINEPHMGPSSDLSIFNPLSFAIPESTRPLVQHSGVLNDPVASASAIQTYMNLIEEQKKEEERRSILVRSYADILRDRQNQNVERSIEELSAATVNVRPVSISNQPPVFPTIAREPVPNSYPPTSQVTSADSETINDSTPPQVNSNSFVNCSPNTKPPEWKRYKQYSKEDLQAAISAVKAGETALHASRKYKVPSRTLYDKIKKLGINTSSSRRISNGARRNGNNIPSLVPTPYTNFNLDASESYSFDQRMNASRVSGRHPYSAPQSERSDSRPQSVESSTTSESIHPVDLHVQRMITTERNSEDQQAENHLKSRFNSFQPNFSPSLNNIPTTIEALNLPSRNSPMEGYPQHQNSQYLAEFRNRMGLYADRNLNRISPGEEKDKKAEEDCDLVVDSETDEKETPGKNSGSECESSAYASKSSNIDQSPTNSPTNRDSGNETANIESYDKESNKLVYNNNNSSEKITPVSPKSSESSSTQVSPVLSEKSSGEFDYVTMSTKSSSPSRSLHAEISHCSQLRALDLRENIPIPQESN